MRAREWALPTPRNGGVGPSQLTEIKSTVAPIAQAAFVPLTAPELTLLRELSGASERHRVDGKSLISRQIHFTFVKSA